MLGLTDTALLLHPVVPDLLGLAALQLLQVEGQRQQQVTQVLAREGEGVVGGGLRWQGRERGDGWRRRRCGGRRG